MQTCVVVYKNNNEKNTKVPEEFKKIVQDYQSFTKTQVLKVCVEEAFLKYLKIDILTKIVQEIDSVSRIEGKNKKVFGKKK